MSQITRRGVEDNAIAGEKIRLDNNQALRGRNSAGTTDVEIVRVTTANRVEFPNLPKVADNLPLPSADKDLVTIEYIRNVVKGKADAKDAVNFLTTANTALSGTVASLLAIADGATPQNGNRVGLTFQANGAENGIYDLTITGANYSLARSIDFDEGTSVLEVTTGAYFLVVAGTVYSGYEVLLTTPDPIVIGTTALTFVRYPSTLSLTAGDMLRRVGNDFSVDLAPISGLESTTPGAQNGQLRVKADTATLEKDKTTRLDPATGAVVAKRLTKELFTLQGIDITNGYVDLQHVAGEGSVGVTIVGFGGQIEGDDYTVNYTGGTSSKTRVTFAGGLAIGGVSALILGDKVQVEYEAF